MGLHVIVLVWAQADILYLIARGQRRAVDLHFNFTLYFSSLSSSLKFCLLTRLMRMQGSRAHTHANTRLPAADTRAVDEQPLLPAGVVLWILHALNAARSVALSVTHTQMPPGEYPGRAIPRRTNGGTLTLVHGCSSAVQPIAFRDHTHVTDARCLCPCTRGRRSGSSCRAGP